MFRMKTRITASITSLIALSTSAHAQTAASTHPHMVVIKLVEKGGAMPYAFEPATSVAQRGDTVRFLNAVDVMHDVRFTKEAAGSKLGSAITGPYLTAKGMTYDVIIDARFTDGTYAFVCDPHEAIGMKGTLIITGAKIAAGPK
jgi:plastocyanin